MKITIRDNDTNETGTYKIWFTMNKKEQAVVMSEGEINALLDMRQKERFFMGHSSFILKSSFDIQRLVSKIPY
jgi:hypothetical protein